MVISHIVLHTELTKSSGNRMKTEFEGGAGTSEPGWRKSSGLTRIGEYGKTETATEAPIYFQPRN
jgi:hypothetical protein